MPENNVDVVISGGGPNGLMLAAELLLAGIRPVVLERLPGPNEEPRANGLVGQVVRLLDMRGLYEECAGRPGPPEAAPGFYFGGMPLSLDAVENNAMFLMMLPQPRLIRLLAKRVQELRGEIRWGHESTGFEQRDGSLWIDVAGPAGNYRMCARYLVGADGGKSTVRKQAGIAFPGTTSQTVTRIAHVTLPASMRAADGGLDIPGAGHFSPGFTRLDTGTFVFAELEPGRPLIAVGELGNAAVTGPMTYHELRESMHRVLGVRVEFSPPTGPGPHALRRIDGQNTRQAEVFRKGNVLLVGDAAHVHSAMGGPGLNLGLQDVANLGWKLAADINGWAPPDLLDTYHAERHPVGERVITHSLAQTALMMPGPEVSALRGLLGELLEMPENAGHIAHLLAGSEARYATGDQHELSGRMVPDFVVRTERGPQRTAELLHQARPVLLDLTGGDFVEAARGWRDRVDLVPASGVTTPAAVLIRPDGYVAWAADAAEHSDQARLHQCLTRWFGRPRAESRATESIVA